MWFTYFSAFFLLPQVELFELRCCVCVMCEWVKPLRYSVAVVLHQNVQSILEHLDFGVSVY